MITKNIRNILHLRANVNDITAKSVNSDLISSNFEKYNSMNEIRYLGISNFKNNESFYHMIAMRLINTWRILIDGKNVITFKDLLTQGLLKSYSAHTSLFENEFLELYLDDEDSIMVYYDAQITSLFNRTYNKVIIKGSSTVVEFENCNIFYVLEQYFNTIHNLKGNVVLSKMLEIFEENSNYDENSIIDYTKYITDEKLLQVQNNIILNFLKYENYFSMFYQIQDLYLLENGIDEIVDIILNIMNNTPENISDEINNASNAYFKLNSMKDLFKFDSLFEFINEIPGFKYSSSFNMGFSKEMTEKLIKIITNLNGGSSLSQIVTKIDNETINDFDYQNTFTYVADFKNPNLKLDVIQSFKLSLFNRISKYIASINPDINKNTIIMSRVRQTIYSFVSNQLIGPLPYDATVSAEDLKNYLLYMDGSSIFNSISSFLNDISQKLLGISDLNPTWNINLLQDLTDQITTYLDEQLGYSLFKSDSKNMYSALSLEASRVLESYLGSVVKKVDDDIFHILNIYSVNNIFKNMNVILNEFTTLTFKIMKPLMEISFESFEDKLDNLSDISLKVLFTDLVSKIIPTLFINIMFNRNTLNASNNVFSNGSFMTTNYQSFNIYDVYHALIYNKSLNFTMFEFLKYDAYDDLNEFLKFGYINAKNVGNNIDYINFSDNSISIDFITRKYYINEETDYSMMVETILIDNGFNSKEGTQNNISPNMMNINNIQNKDILLFYKIKGVNFTPINLSKFIKYIDHMDKFYFTPDIKKNIPKIFLDDLFLIFNKVGPINEQYGKKSLNLLLINKHPKTLLYKSKSDLFRYDSEDTLALNNYEISTINPNLIIYYDGSNYAINTLLNNPRFVRKHVKDFSNKFVKTFLEDGSFGEALDFLDKKHRDLRINYISSLKYNALYNILSGNYAKLFEDYPLFKSSFFDQVAKRLSMQHDLEILHEITLMRSVK